MSIVIMGAGPNLGLPVARRFGREGMAAGLIARDAAKLEGLVGGLRGPDGRL
jgi:short-subunit dehydrogenase